MHVGRTILVPSELVWPITCPRSSESKPKYCLHLGDFYAPGPFGVVDSFSPCTSVGTDRIVALDLLDR